MATACKALLLSLLLLLSGDRSFAQYHKLSSHKLSSKDSAIEASRWTSDLEVLAQETEQDYALPRNLCRAVSWKESRHDPHALRTEGNYTIAKTRMARTIRARSKAFSRKHGGIPSVLTEIFQEGSSHTRFQFLGVNLRDHGVKDVYLDNIDDTTAFRVLGEFYTPLLRKHDLYTAIGLYNGPHFPASYPRDIMGLMEEFNKRASVTQ